LSSNFPPWFADLGTLSSIVGLGITILLLWEARKIRDSFIRRARLPEIIKDLVVANKVIAKNLKEWDKEGNEGLRQFKIARELLENIKPKLPDIEKKKVNNYVQKLEKRSYIFFTTTITIATTDKAWDLYSELSALITALQQLQKDSKWD
jgi:CHAD domain-containing protein